MLKARKKDMSTAALIPGLAVKVEGTYNAQKELVATNQSGSRAMIWNGPRPSMPVCTKRRHRLGQNQEELEKLKSSLRATAGTISWNIMPRSPQIRQPSMPRSRGSGNWMTTIFSMSLQCTSGTVRVKVDPKYNSQLMALVEKSKTIEGYMIEVKGFASATGSTAMNQKLSEDRANSRYQHPDSTGSRSPHQNAGTRRYGRKRASRRERKDSGRASAESSRSGACSAKHSHCRRFAREVISTKMT